jgi:hypothetical protein
MLRCSTDHCCQSKYRLLEALYVKHQFPLFVGELIDWDSASKAPEWPYELIPPIFYLGQLTPLKIEL